MQHKFKINLLNLTFKLMKNFLVWGVVFFLFFMFFMLNKKFSYNNLTTVHKNLFFYIDQTNINYKLTNNTSLSYLNTPKSFFKIDNKRHLNGNFLLHHTIKNTKQFNQFIVMKVIKKINQLNFFVPFIKPCYTFFKNYCYKYDVVTDDVNFKFLKQNKDIGLNDIEINNFIKVVQSQFNYYKFKKNNSINIFIVHPKFIDNHIYNKNKIIGFKIFDKIKNYYGILAKNGKFYDEKGNGFVSTFLKSPLIKKYRISSQFNPNRVHPITKKISPHQGIDLAIPLGTPVLSVGNGIVITTRSSVEAGKYITIQHDSNCITRYMHLQKILVKVGDQIKIGQKIGLSGSTGYSTGPHLHYEVWFKNKVINPLSLKTKEQLTGKDLKDHLCFSNLIINKF